MPFYKLYGEDESIICFRKRHLELDNEGTKNKIETMLNKQWLIILLRKLKICLKITI